MLIAMKRYASVALIISLLSPVSALAQTGDALDVSIDMWEKVADSLRTEENMQSADAQMSITAELFPDTGEVEEGNELEERRDERTSEYVSVQIDGKLTIFKDVPRTAWFAPYVRDVADKGIVSGYRDAEGRATGFYGPGDNVTLEQVAKVLVYASGKDLDTCGKSTLNLTASGSWSGSFVGCAEFSHWSVYEDGSADMHRPATRSEVIITLLQAFDVKIGERSVSDSGFTDVTTTTLFGGAIEQAKNDGIVAGYTDAQGMPNGFFGPEDPVTRAEFAKIITNGMQRYGRR